jgi:rhodanese-related sulfurtransferase
MRIQLLARALAPALFAALLPLAAASEEANPVKQMSPAELRARQAHPFVLVIDVRTKEEYDAGHIPGARNMPYGESQDLLTMVRWAGADDVVVYCMKGTRARLAEAELVQSGVRGVAHLEGGFEAWKAAGLPIEGGAARQR